jgi:murein DD-endopeptidase MepM/ murein hydrolase activator NlpD
MKKIYFILFIIFFSACLFFLAGCVSASYVSSTYIPSVTATPGVYHSVEKGQTLWKISKMYSIDLEELAQANRITDTTAIEVGQQIFIPNRSKPQIQVVQTDDNDDFSWPIKGKVVSSFGQITNNMVNKGINIQPYQSLEVVASRSGKVIFLGEDFAGMGKTIIIEHPDGLFTVYSRNAAVFVKIGDNVNKGSVISKAGFAGRDRNVCLHFEVRKGSVAQNPLYYLP